MSTLSDHADSKAGEKMQIHHLCWIATCVCADLVTDIKIPKPEIDIVSIPGNECPPSRHSKHSIIVLSPLFLCEEKLR